MANYSSGRIYHVPILSKALEIIELLQTDNQSISIEDIYRQTRFSKSSVYRILKTLEHRGYLDREEDGRYRLVSRRSKPRFGYGKLSEESSLSQAVTSSLKEAAAAAGVDLFVLDNQCDPQAALRNAERFILEHVDLVIEFQVDPGVAPIIADKITIAGIPLIAIEMTHPNATFFGVDNYRIGLEMGRFLGEYAWKAGSENAPWVLGLDIEDAGSLVRSRITGAFEGIREAWPELSVERFVRMDTRGLSEKGYELAREFLLGHPNERSILVAAANDIIALGASRAAKELKREKHVAIVGHDCIPDALNEMKIPGTPVVASVSREVQTYGPRLMQLGRALIRGQYVAPYQYVNHKLVKAEELAGRAHDSALVGARTARRDRMRRRAGT
ncbi:MAG: substrate-binding domain-containing protein [Terriglobales bacterium]